MVMTLDLTPRQASRVVRQALATGATLDLEPRSGPERTIPARFIKEENNLLIVEPTQTPGTPLIELVGSFCDIRVRMSEQLYLFTTCVLDLDEAHSPPTLMLAIPDSIQVANRRRFERHNFPVTAQVRLWTEGAQTHSVAMLTDVSALGLGIEAPGTDLDDALLLGDVIRASFELPGCDETFELPALVCSKELARDRQMTVLGLEFHLEANDSVGRYTLERLRVALGKVTSQDTETDGSL
ncbi:MAG: PilZ domain-containing protein [Phycisphaerales bacterium]|nr:PilZ domain-containing protein [Phycisphaerales bacterium]